MKQGGVVIICDPKADKPILELGTAQCVHCGGHFPIRPGSRKIRGFCGNCNGPVCGPNCQKCVPTEVLLENYERHRPLDFRPVVGVVFNQMEGF